MVSKRPQMELERPCILVVCEPTSSLQQAAGDLKAEGFRIRNARSTYRAIVEQTSAPAEVVLIDTAPLLERDMEVFDVLRSLTPPPFLLASLPPSAREKARMALERGADAYVLEPFDSKEITLLLRRSLERRAAPSESLPLNEKLASLARFAAGVAHEVNNPLTTISGWIQLSLSDMRQDDPNRRTFETMQEEAERIAAIVRNLLCFAGQPPLEEEPVDINQLLDEVVKTSGVFSSEEKTPDVLSGVHVASYFHEALPLILANRGQIRRACEQVIQAALQHLGGHGELLIATRPGGGEDQVLIEIADDGPNIPAANLSRVFDPFFNDGSNGGGLGLSAAYGIVQGHGGTIDVTSREGEGTRFVIHLPLHRLRTRNRIFEYAK
jgi:two-component system NtrC family sensor kinase